MDLNSHQAAIRNLAHSVEQGVDIMSEGMKKMILLSTERLTNAVLFSY